MYVLCPRSVGTYVGGQGFSALACADACISFAGFDCNGYVRRFFLQFLLDLSCRGTATKLVLSGLVSL